MTVLPLSKIECEVKSDFGFGQSCDTRFYKCVANESSPLTGYTIAVVIILALFVLIAYKMRKKPKQRELKEFI